MLEWSSLYNLRQGRRVQPSLEGMGNDEAHHYVGDGDKPVGHGDFLADLSRKWQVVRSRTNGRTDVEGGS